MGSSLVSLQVSRRVALDGTNIQPPVVLATISTTDQLGCIIALEIESAGPHHCLLSQSASINSFEMETP